MHESAKTVLFKIVSSGASLQLAAGCKSRSAEKCSGKIRCLGEGSMKKDHENNEQRQGGPVESVC